MKPLAKLAKLQKRQLREREVKAMEQIASHLESIRKFLEALWRRRSPKC